MNNKVLSIVSYISLIGWLIAFFVGKEKADDLLRYHLKQSLGLVIVSIIFQIIITIVLSIIPSLAVIGYIGYVFLILMIIGIINAANEKKKPLPIIGNWAANSFAFLNK